LPNPVLALVEVEWAVEDALRFALCHSAITDEAHGSVAINDVGVARGNVVLADHGLRVAPESLGKVPRPSLFAPVATRAACADAVAQPLPARWRPTLLQPALTSLQPVTQAAPLPADASAAPAAWVLSQDLAQVRPQVELEGVLGSDVRAWGAVRNLFEAGADDENFVVEVENDGRAKLRFGDGTYGRRPRRDTAFTASYRVGNGSAGLLGADALWHVVGADVSAIIALRNPLPAAGAREPEAAESVRRRAPEAFRTQQRAVTPTDYAARTEAFGGVQRAAARMRWTGAWHTVFVTVDRTGGGELSSAGRAAVAVHLDRYRMAGHDIAFEPPVAVSLQLALHVCVADDHFRADVRQRLEALFSSRGVFAPDSFSFGQTVWLSPLLAAARGVPGVASVEARVFGRQGSSDPLPLTDGRVRLARREIARLDNNPNFPEHGKLTLALHGGK